jgi:hypothetical protein
MFFDHGDGRPSSEINILVADTRGQAAQWDLRSATGMANRGHELTKFAARRHFLLRKTGLARGPEFA